MNGYLFGQDETVCKYLALCYVPLMKAESDKRMDSYDLLHK